MQKADTRTQADIIRAMFAAADSGDLEGQLSFVTDDISLAFGNATPVVGKQAISSQTNQFLTTVRGFRHEIHAIWSVHDADVLIGQMTVHYTKHDGSSVSLPCCNVFHMRGDLIGDYRIYMDVSPLFA